RHERHKKKTEDILSKKQKRPSRVRSADDALVLELGIVAEVQEQSEAEPGGLQGVVGLGAMVRDEVRHGLDFHDDLGETEKVRLEPGLELSVLVEQDQLLLRLERNRPQTNLDLQTLLIHRLQKSR